MEDYPLVTWQEDEKEPLIQEPHPQYGRGRASVSHIDEVSPRYLQEPWRGNQGDLRQKLSRHLSGNWQICHGDYHLRGEGKTGWSLECGRGSELGFGCAGRSGGGQWDWRASGPSVGVVGGRCPCWPGTVKCNIWPEWITWLSWEVRMWPPGDKKWMEPPTCVGLIICPCALEMKAYGLAWYAPLRGDHSPSPDSPLKLPAPRACDTTIPASWPPAPTPLPAWASPPWCWPPWYTPLPSMLPWSPPSLPTLSTSMCCSRCICCSAGQTTAWGHGDVGGEGCRGRVGTCGGESQRGLLEWVTL